jgi:SpoIID/LytB domain protein
VFTPRSGAQTGIRIGVLSGGVHTITVVSLDTYVARVLAGEAAPNTAPAALEALAVAVRTYTAANLGKHRSDGFDLCDQTHCQVMRTANSDTQRAAEATAGLVLLNGDVPATIYYSASCGGRSEIPSAVWPGSPDPPHLPSRDDDACRGFPAWSAELATADLQRALAAGGFRGTLRDIRIASRHPSGRVDKLILEGMEPRQISGQDLRMVVGPTLGWLRILSTSFELRRVDGGFRFAGRGSGHGVGMCVIGAMHRAEAGETAREILERYYPGLQIGQYVPRAAPTPPVVPTPVATTVSSSSAPISRRTDIVVGLPQRDATDLAALESLAARARDDLVRTLGVPAPASLTLTFHASPGAFEQASGRSWFASGAVVDGRLHFLPVPTLRDRGVLERTIRRTLVQLLTESVLESRPLWVREGVASYYADAPSTVQAEPRAVCPSDSELSRPVSAGALSEAYARARFCVARQLASGKAWQELR